MQHHGDEFKFSQRGFETSLRFLPRKNCGDDDATNSVAGNKKSKKTAVWRRLLRKKDKSRDDEKTLDAVGMSRIPSSCSSTTEESQDSAYLNPREKINTSTRDFNSRRTFEGTYGSIGGYCLFWIFPLSCRHVHSSYHTRNLRSHLPPGT